MGENIGRNVEKRRPSVIIHPSAYIEDGVTMGDSVEIGPNVVIYEGTSLGNGVRVGANSVLGQAYKSQVQHLKGFWRHAGTYSG